jgi:hypothetical protein
LFFLFPEFIKNVLDSFFGHGIAAEDGAGVGMQRFKMCFKSPFEYEFAACINKPDAVRLLFHI